MVLVILMISVCMLQYVLHGLINGVHLQCGVWGLVEQLIQSMLALFLSLATVLVFDRVRSILTRLSQHGCSIA